MSPSDQAALQGAKKGGGGHTPVESPDNLRSQQMAQVQDLISEGEIKGLVSGLRSVYLDGVPIENADGSKNFEGVSFGITTGSQTQDALPGFDAVESEQAVGVEIRQSTPVVRTIVNTSVDTVRVTISVPRLSELDVSNGDMRGSSFSYAIDVQSSGGGFVTMHTDTITGKTTSVYKRSTRIPLSGSGPWDVRVRRVSPDSTSSAIENSFFWDSFTEIQSVTLRYPNSAVAGLRVSARQFSTVPTRAYDVLGLLVRVPVNYDPIAGTYDGVWNGTFKLAWTCNPAWIYFDLATHPRYGLGRYIQDHHLDKWALYQIGRYCDEKVSDGLGGLEPRFTCNLYLQTREQAYQVLQDLASLFRCISFWGNGRISLVQDAPSDAVALFTAANVVDGLFTYQTASNRLRHSVWTVYYNDLAQLGKRVPEVYVDPDLVKRFGVVDETLSPVGCTSRGQAQRLARWAAYSEAADEMITFSVGLDGAIVGPGDVFKVHDPDEAGKRLGGRVATAVANQVTLDASITLEVGQTYTLSVMLPDADRAPAYKTEERQVIAAAGKVITVSPPYSAAPAAGTIWILKQTSIEPTWWRCIDRTESQGGATYQITAIAHDPLKYAAIEQGLKLEPRPRSGLTGVPPRLTGLEIIETPYADGPVPRIRVSVSWVEPAPGLRYRLTWRLNSGPWQTMPDSSSNLVDVDGLQTGLFEVSVQAINSLGRASPAATASVELLGKATPGPGVGDLIVVQTLSGLRASWAPCEDLLYGTTKVFVGPALSPEDQIDPDAVAAALASATEIWSGRASSHEWTPTADGTYTVWAVHFDSLGNPTASPPWVLVDYEATVLPLLRLVVSSPVFSVNAEGNASPTSIQLTVLGIAAGGGPVVWEIIEGTATLEAVPGEPYMRSLAFEDLVSDAVTIQVSQGALFDITTVLKLRDSDGARILLSNPFHLVPAAADGTASEAALAAAETSLTIYMAGEDVTSAWTITHTDSGLVSARSGNTWHLTEMAGDTGLISFEATQAGYSALAAQFRVAKVRAGANGMRTAEVKVYKWAASTPAAPSGTSTYTWATGGLSSAPAGWSLLPGAAVPGQSLYAALVRLANTSTSATDPVDWSTSNVIVIGGAGSNGAPGGAGMRTAEVKVFKWAASTPAAPTGDSNYTWSTGSLDVVPSGWVAAPGAPVAGWTLYAAVVRLANTNTTPTDLVTWAAASVIAQTATGPQGPAGEAGNQSATVYLYQWGVGEPPAPSGTATYTWATGVQADYGGASGWSITVPANPGTPGAALWVASKGLTASALAEVTEISWSGASIAARSANGLQGPGGPAGVQAAQPTVYKWSAILPEAPTGAATYTWATAAINAAPAGWSAQPTVPPAPGYTLWAATVALADSATAATTDFNWGAASISARGYAGTNGAPGGSGSQGMQGASTRVCYARVPGNPAPLDAQIATAGSTSYPTAGQSAAAWGINLAWGASDPDPTSTASLYQSIGYYNPATAQTVWDRPFVASLRVGTLSAAAVNTGSLNVTGDLKTTTGALLGGDYTGNAWPASGGKGFFLSHVGLKMGNLNDGRFFAVDVDGNVSMPGLTISNGSASYRGALSGGAYSSTYAWPASGGGFHLSQSGLLLGDLSAGRYIEINASGNIYAPGFSIVNGLAAFSGAISGSVVTGGVIQTAISGQRITLNESALNVARFYGNAGGGLEMLAQVGAVSYGSIYSIIQAGSQTSGNATAGVQGLSNSNAGVAGSSVSSQGVRGFSQSADGVLGYTSGSGAGVQGLHQGGGRGVLAYSSGGTGLQAVGSRAIETQGGASFSMDGAHDPYGTVSVTRGTGLSYSYYSMTRNGQMVYGMGIDTSNRMWIGVPTPGHSAVLSTPYMYLSYLGVQVPGGFGVNGKTPQTAYGLPGAPAADVDSLRYVLTEVMQALKNCGICV